MSEDSPAPLVRRSTTLALASDADPHLADAVRLADDVHLPGREPGTGWMRARTLALPEHAIGHLRTWSPRDTAQAGDEPWHASGWSFALAQGDVTVAADTAVELCLTSFTDEALAAVARLDAGAIQAISVADEAVAVPELLRAIAHITDLRRITISRVHVQPRHLRRLVLVEHLELADCTGFRGADSLDVLHAMPHLATLRLSRIDAPREAFVRMPEFEHLRELHASGTAIDDEGLACISASAPNLTTLELACTGVTGSGLCALGSTAELRALDLGGLPVDDDDVRTLLSGTRLRTVDLHGTSIGDVTLERLAAHRDLEELKLRSCAAVTDAGIRELRPCTRIWLLWICRTGASGASLEHASALPLLRNLGIGDLDATDADLAHLHRLSDELGGLWADGNPRLSDAALACLLAKCRELTGVKLTGPGTGPRTIGALASLHGLWHLTLHDVPISTAIMRRIASCSSLEVLALRSCGISDAQGELLDRLDQLRTLDLSGNPEVADRTAGAIAHLERLRSLVLDDTSDGDEMLAANASPPGARDMVTGDDLEVLRERVTRREAELAALQHELLHFHGEYADRVGERQARLDELRAQAAAPAPRDRTPEDDRELLTEDQRKALQRLYRSVVRHVHPDLAADGEAVELRTALMCEAREAFERGDADALAAMHEHGDRIGHELVRLRMRLVAAETQLDSLTCGFLYDLMQRTRDAAMEGCDLLELMAARLDERIEATRARGRSEAASSNG